MTVAFALEVDLSPVRTENFVLFRNSDWLLFYDATLSFRLLMKGDNVHALITCNGIIVSCDTTYDSSLPRAIHAEPDLMDPPQIRSLPESRTETKISKSAAVNPSAARRIFSSLRPWKNKKGPQERQAGRKQKGKERGYIQGRQADPIGFNENDPIGHEDTGKWDVGLSHQRGRITPEVLHKFRDLLRQRYSLDAEIWQLRDVGQPDRSLVEGKMRQSDAILVEIKAIVESWAQNGSWAQDEIGMVMEIQQRLWEENKRHWTGNAPWDED